MSKFCQSCSAFAAILMRSSVLYLAVLLIPLCWLTYAVATSREHSRGISAAEFRLSNLTLVYEQHLESEFLDVDRSLRLLRLLYERDQGRFDLKYWTDSAALTSRTVIRFTVIDRDGFVTATTSELGQPTFLGDREYFSALAAANMDVLHISAVENGRVVAGSSIKVARPLFDTDGHFAGALVASLDPKEIVKFFGTANLGAHGSLSLRNADLTILAAQGLSSSLVGGRLSAPPLGGRAQKRDPPDFTGAMALSTGSIVWLHSESPRTCRWSWSPEWAKTKSSPSSGGSGRSTAS